MSIKEAKLTSSSDLEEEEEEEREEIPTKKLQDKIPSNSFAWKLHEMFVKNP